ncbi:MAG: YkgJ family cysteine cluster protein [Desulfomonilaceae bacterium]
MSDTLIDRNQLTDEEWESICRKCGRCCYEKIDIGGGRIIYTKEPCVYLDTVTRMCKIYDRRHEIEPDCIKLNEDFIRTIDWMPPGCAYVQYINQKDTLRSVRSVEKSKRKKRTKTRRI